MDLNSDDIYEIRDGGLLSNVDQQILTKLYLPIIGTGAYALYLALWSELDNQKILSLSYQHQRLFKLLEVSSSQFLKYRQILEAIGLLATYLNDQEKPNTLIYHLILPRLADSFFSEPTLNQLLLMRLGEVDFEIAKSYFTHSKKVNFPNISANFDQIFKFVDNHLQVSDFYHVPQRDQDNLSYTLNIKELLSSLDARKVDVSTLTVIDQKQIIAFANIYRLDELQLKEIIENSYFFNTKKIDYQVFSDKIYKIVKERNIQLSDKNIIDVIDKYNPIEFLKYLHFGRKILSSDIKKIENLIIESGLEESVINVIIYHVLTKYNNKLYLPYLKDIAGTFIRENIKNSKDAIKYLYKQDKIIPTIKNDLQDESLSPEQQAKLEKLLKEFE